jgi:glycosyltransferase involved in cell wall biosynthesis
MKLSVIIPCYNAAKTLPCQLDALVRERWAQPWELIVADNGSADESVWIAKAYQDQMPELRVVSATARRGAGHARNVGAMAATGEALIFCDADDQVSPGYLAAMHRALSQHDFVAGRLECTLLNHSWLHQGRVAAQDQGLNDAFCPPYLVAGSDNLGVKKWVHELIGGFDETLLRLQDYDYCIRVQRAGIQLHFVPDAVVHVRYRQGLLANFEQTRSWGEHSIRVRQRYLPTDLSWRAQWQSFLRTSKHLLWRLLRMRRSQDLAEWLFLAFFEIGVIQGKWKARRQPPCRTLA